MAVSLSLIALVPALIIPAFMLGPFAIGVVVPLIPLFIAIVIAIRPRIR